MSSDDDDYGAPPPPGGGGLDGTGKFDTSAIRAQHTAQFDPDDAPPPMKRSSTVTLEGGNLDDGDDDNTSADENSYPTSPWGRGMAPAQSFRLYATNSMMMPSLSGAFGPSGSMSGANYGFEMSGINDLEASVTGGGFNQSVNATPRAAGNVIRNSMASLKKFLFSTGENIGTHNAKPPEPEKEELEDKNVILQNKDVVESTTADLEQYTRYGSFQGFPVQHLSSGSFKGEDSGESPPTSDKNNLNNSSGVMSSNGNVHQRLGGSINITPPLFGIMTTPASSRGGDNSNSKQNNNKNQHDESPAPPGTFSALPGSAYSNNNNNNDNNNNGGRPFNIGNYSITSVASGVADDVSFENLQHNNNNTNNEGKYPYSNSTSLSGGGRNNSVSHGEIVGAERVLNDSMTYSARDDAYGASGYNINNNNRTPTNASSSTTLNPRPNSASLTQTPAELEKRGIHNITSSSSTQHNNNNKKPNNTNNSGGRSPKNNTTSAVRRESYSDVSWAASSAPTSGRDQGITSTNTTNSNNTAHPTNVQLPRKLESSANTSPNATLQSSKHEKEDENNNSKANKNNNDEGPGTARGGDPTKTPTAATPLRDDDDYDPTLENAVQPPSHLSHSRLSVTNLSSPSANGEHQGEGHEEEEASSPHFQKEGDTSLRRGPMVGQGGFATVYVGLLTHGKFQRVVAIKEIEFDTDVSSEELRGVAQEFELLRSFRHPNVIRYVFFDYSTSKKVCRIVMEYVSAGSLQAVVLQGQILSENVLREFTKQLLEGIAYIHSHGISHRDIKPANVLLHHDGTVKLADFGCSRCLNQLVETSKHVFGSPIYMAPEQIEGEIMASSDIWSLACTVLELATGKQPWYETGLKQNLYLMFHITGKDTIPYFPGTLGSNDFRDFLKSCFTRDASTRPSAKELLEHAWITNHNSSQHSGPPPPSAKINSRTDSITSAVTPRGEDAASAGPPAVNNEAKTPSGIEATLSALGVGPGNNSNYNLKKERSGSHSNSANGGSPTHSQTSSSHRILTAKQEIEEICARQVSVIVSQLIGIPQSPLPSSGLLQIPRRESVVPQKMNNNSKDSRGGSPNNNNNNATTPTSEGFAGKRDPSSTNLLRQQQTHSNPNLLHAESNQQHRIERSNSIMSLTSNPPMGSGNHPVVRASSGNQQKEDGTSPSAGASTSQHPFGTESGESGFGNFAFPTMVGVSNSAQQAMSRKMSMIPGANNSGNPNGGQAGAGAFSANPEQQQQQLVIEIEETIAAPAPGSTTTDGASQSSFNNIKRNSGDAGSSNGSPGMFSLATNSNNNNFDASGNNNSNSNNITSTITATTATITDAASTMQGARMERSKSMAAFAGFGDYFPSPERHQSNLQSREESPRANDSMMIDPPDQLGSMNENNSHHHLRRASTSSQRTSPHGTPKPAASINKPTRPITVAVPIAPDAPPVMLELEPEDLIEAPNQGEGSGNYESFDNNNFNNTNSNTNFGENVTSGGNSLQNTLQATQDAFTIGRRRSSATVGENGSNSNIASATESPFSTSSLQPSQTANMPASGTSFGSNNAHSNTNAFGGAQSYASFRLERTASIAAAGGSNTTNPLFSGQQQQQQLLRRKKSYVVNLGSENVRQQLQHAMLERKKSMALTASNLLNSPTTTEEGSGKNLKPFSSSSPETNNNNKDDDSISIASSSSSSPASSSTPFSNNSNQQRQHRRASEPKMTIPTQEIEEEYAQTHLHAQASFLAQQHYGSMRRISTSSFSAGGNTFSGNPQHNRSMHNASSANFSQTGGGGGGSQYDMCQSYSNRESPVVIPGGANAQGGGTTATTNYNKNDSDKIFSDGIFGQKVSSPGQKNLSSEDTLNGSQEFHAAGGGGSAAVSIKINADNNNNFKLNPSKPRGSPSPSRSPAQQQQQSSRPSTADDSSKNNAGAQHQKDTSRGQSESSAPHANTVTSVSSKSHNNNKSSANGNEKNTSNPFSSKASNNPLVEYTGDYVDSPRSNSRNSNSSKPTRDRPTSSNKTKSANGKQTGQDKSDEGNADHPHHQNNNLKNTVPFKDKTTEGDDFPVLQPPPIKQNTNGKVASMSPTSMSSASMTPTSSGQPSSVGGGKFAGVAPLLNNNNNNIGSNNNNNTNVRSDSTLSGSSFGSNPAKSNIITTGAKRISTSTSTPPTSKNPTPTVLPNLKRLSTNNITSSTNSSSSSNSAINNSSNNNNVHHQNSAAPKDPNRETIMMGGSEDILLARKRSNSTIEDDNYNNNQQGSSRKTGSANKNRGDGGMGVPKSNSSSSFQSEDSLPSVVSSSRSGQQKGTILGKTKKEPKELTPSQRRERK